MLVSEKTEHAILRAYRIGSFYMSLKGTLHYTEISFNDPTIAVKVDQSASIRFITQRGIVKTDFGKSAFYRCGVNDIFIRIEAEDQSGEIIFSQPIQLMTKKLKAR